MIDPHDRGDISILRCPKCSTLFGPKMTECSNCGGPLVPALGPKQLSDVPFVVFDLPAGTYTRDAPFPVPSPYKVDR